MDGMCWIPACLDAHLICPLFPKRILQSSGSFRASFNRLLRRASDLDSAVLHVRSTLDKDLRAGEKALAQLLCLSASVQATLALCSSPPLLNQPVPGLSEIAHLVVLHALQPVAKGGADQAVDGVCEKSLAVEEGAHLNTELP